MFASAQVYHETKFIQLFKGLMSYEVTLANLAQECHPLLPPEIIKKVHKKLKRNSKQSMRFMTINMEIKRSSLQKQKVKRNFSL